MKTITSKQISQQRLSGTWAVVQQFVKLACSRCAKYWARTGKHAVFLEQKAVAEYVVYLQQ